MGSTPGAPCTGSPTRAGRSRCCTASARAATPTAAGSWRSACSARWRSCASVAARVLVGWPHDRAVAPPRSRGAGVFALFLCCGCPAARWARNGPAARARPPRCCHTTPHLRPASSSGATDGDLHRRPRRRDRRRANRDTGAAEAAAAGSAPTARCRCDEHLAVHGPLPSVRSDAAAPRARAGEMLFAETSSAPGCSAAAARGSPRPRRCARWPAAQGRAIVVANGGEGEPASLKDRTLLQSRSRTWCSTAPSLAAEAVGADEVIVCVCESADGGPRERRRARSRNAPASRALARAAPGDGARATTSPARSPRSSTTSAAAPPSRRSRRRARSNAASAAPDAGQQRRDARPRRADRPTTARRGSAELGTAGAARVGARDAVRAGRPPRRLRDRARRLAVLADRRPAAAPPRACAARCSAATPARGWAAELLNGVALSNEHLAPARRVARAPASCCCSPRRRARSPKRRASRAGSRARAPASAARASTASTRWPARSRRSPPASPARAWRSASISSLSLVARRGACGHPTARSSRSSAPWRSSRRVRRPRAPRAVRAPARGPPELPLPERPVSDAHRREARR